MNLTITEKAAAFYKQEMELESGQSLWLYVRVGGIGSGGFSAGIQPGLPDTPALPVTAGEIHFHVTEADAWYFDGITIDYDEDMEEIVFSHLETNDLFNPNGPHKK